MADEQFIGRLMGQMSLAWPKYELSKATIAVYARLLMDIPAGALETGAKYLMTTATFFPSVAEWRRAAFEILSGARMTPTAFEAWQEVRQVMAEVGSYRQPNFSHPLIQKTVDAFGWRDLCVSENGEYDRSQFYKIYDTYKRRAEEDMSMLPEVRARMNDLPSAETKPGLLGGTDAIEH